MTFDMHYTGWVHVKQDVFYSHNVLSLLKCKRKCKCQHYYIRLKNCSLSGKKSLLMKFGQSAVLFQPLLLIGDFHKYLVYR